MCLLRGQGEAEGEGGVLTSTTKPPDALHQHVDLCQCHKDLISLFSMCTYLFTDFCLVMFLFVSASLDFHLSSIKGHFEQFQRLTQEGSTLFAVIFRSQI